MTNAAVFAWLGRAREALSDARLLADAGRLRACVNRLYFACFYAATALLISRGLTSSKHSGVRALLHQHVVRSGEVPRDLARSYDTLFDSRLEGDYQALHEFSAEDVAVWMDGAERFVTHIEGLLSTESDGTTQ